MAVGLICFFGAFKEFKRLETNNPTPVAREGTRTEYDRAVKCREATHAVFASGRYHDQYAVRAFETNNPHTQRVAWGNRLGEVPPWKPDDHPGCTTPGRYLATTCTTSMHTGSGGMGGCRADGGVARWCASIGGVHTLSNTLQGSQRGRVHRSEGEQLRSEGGPAVLATHPNSLKSRRFLKLVAKFGG